MTKDQLIKDLFNSDQVQKMIDNITPDQYYRQELKSTLFLILCEKSESFLLAIENINGWIYETLKNQFNSGTSDFYKSIKRPRQSTVDHIDEDGNDSLADLAEEKNNFHDLADIAEKEYSKLHQADQMIVDHLKLKQTYKQIAAERGINSKYVSEMAKRITKDLKSKIRKEL